MVFSSTIFLFFFLPVVLTLYYLTPRALKNTMLLAASLFFYAWGEGIFVALMLASIGVNYICGLLVERYRDRLGSKVALGLGVFANLSFLAAFKYANFIVDNLNTLFRELSLQPIRLEEIPLPIGISFFTFQAMSYLIDLYRADAPVQKNPLKLALFISLFPQLIAGPIVRYAAIAKQLSERTTSIEKFSDGAARFCIGLGKKVLIANNLGFVADQMFALASTDMGLQHAWLGAVCYGFQIYFDFSGYSDMAIGLGRMFGFEFAENFNYPYIARSIKDFWRRWHISLSTWFRDYLYIPLGGSRGSTWRTYFNLFLVFFLCGLWHGASWNFVVWGMIHGALLVVERLGFEKMLKRQHALLQHVYVLLFVIITWVFFRAETLPAALDYLAVMFGRNGFGAAHESIWIYVNTEVWLCLVAAVLGSTPWMRRAQTELSFSAFEQLGVSAFVGVVFLLSSMHVALGTYNPFIYFRF